MKQENEELLDEKIGCDGKKDLYSENCKMLMKEIKDDTNRWEDILCSWIRKVSVVKMIILPKAIYILNAVTIKLSKAIFVELEQNLFGNIKIHNCS